MDCKVAGTTGTGNLRIRYEDRPDRCGWLLHAFGKFGQAQKVFAHAIQARKAKITFSIK
jgi:hypothetical protein